MANTIASRAPLVVHLLKRQLLCMSPVPSLTPEVFEDGVAVEGGASEGFGGGGERILFGAYGCSPGGGGGGVWVWGA